MGQNARFPVALKIPCGKFIVCFCAHFNVNLWHAQTINFPACSMGCSDATEIDCMRHLGAGGGHKAATYIPTYCSTYLASRTRLSPPSSGKLN